SPGEITALPGPGLAAAAPAAWRDQVRAGLVSLGWQAREADQAIAAIEPELAGGDGDGAQAAVAVSVAPRAALAVPGPPWRERERVVSRPTGEHNESGDRTRERVVSRPTGEHNESGDRTRERVVSRPTGEHNESGDRTRERVVSGLADADDRVVEGALRPRRL